MAALSAGLARCGCDAVQACRGVYVIPMRFSPPRSGVVRVAAEAGRTAQGSAQGRTKKVTKSNAVDANAASLNSAPDDSVAEGNVLRSGEEEPREKDKAPQIPLQQLLMQRLKLDKALDEVVGFMAPREKGDIRDVILMSLSFAVLVYISQRLVCLYCVVRQMASHTF